MKLCTCDLKFVCLHRVHDRSNIKSIVRVDRLCLRQVEDRNQNYRRSCVSSFDSKPLARAWTALGKTVTTCMSFENEVAILCENFRCPHWNLRICFAVDDRSIYTCEVIIRFSYDLIWYFVRANQNHFRVTPVLFVRDMAVMKRLIQGSCAQMYTPSLYAWDKPHPEIVTRSWTRHLHWIASQIFMFGP